MTATELESRWQSISRQGVSTYRSLLLSADSIPELFIGIDIHGERYLILAVPTGYSLSPESIILQNLSFEVQPEDRRIVTGLRNPRFKDLFNDLILSLYNRIRTLTEPAVYIRVFQESFHRWAEFFEDSENCQLSLQEVKGLFGELLVLRHLVQRDFSAEEALNAWLGPYGRSQDFILPAYNVEVKTRDAEQVTVRISSEHQLQPEPGKGLQLTVVTVQEHTDGITLEELSREIRALLTSGNADVTTFQKSLLHAGVSRSDCSLYDNYRWKPQSIAFYDCSDELKFPKITASGLQTGISGVKYKVSLQYIQPFLIQNHIF